MVGRVRRRGQRTADCVPAIPMSETDSKKTLALPSPIEKILVKEFCGDSIYDCSRSQDKVDDTHCTHILIGLR